MVYDPKTPGLDPSVARELEEIRSEFERSQKEFIEYRVHNVAPAKPKEGQAYYADGTNWNPGYGEGLYFYDGTAWIPAWAYITGLGTLTAVAAAADYLMVFDADANTHKKLLIDNFPSGAGVEVGSVIAWPDPTVPTGYLECDGSSLNRTTYAALFAVLGTIYGNVDGSTFNIPDYRGEFLRGQDNGAGTDPDAASRTDRGDTTTGDNVGTKQADDLASHLHTVSIRTNARGGGTFSDHSGSGGSGANTANTGGNETRPTNVYVKWIIKY